MECHKGFANISSRSRAAHLFQLSFCHQLVLGRLQLLLHRPKDLLQVEPGHSVQQVLHGLIPKGGPGRLPCSGGSHAVNGPAGEAGGTAAAPPPPYHEVPAWHSRPLPPSGNRRRAPRRALAGSKPGRGSPRVPHPSPTGRGPRVLPEPPPRAPAPQRPRRARQPPLRCRGTERRHLAHAPSRFAPPRPAGAGRETESRRRGWNGRPGQRPRLREGGKLRGERQIKRSQCVCVVKTPPRRR